MPGTEPGCAGLNRHPRQTCVCGQMHRALCARGTMVRSAYVLLHLAMLRSTVLVRYAQYIQQSVQQHSDFKTETMREMNECV